MVVLEIGAMEGRDVDYATLETTMHRTGNVFFGVMVSMGTLAPPIQMEWTLAFAIDLEGVVSRLAATGV